MQPELDFSAPAVDTPSVSPTGQALPPVSGRTRAARHASATGALAVRETWTARQNAYLQLLNQAGALTDQEAAPLLRCQLCSVNSVRNGIEQAQRDAGLPAMFEADGFEEHRFTDGSGKARVTRRTRWRIRQVARDLARATA